MNNTTTWCGWAKLFGRWIRLTAGHPTLSAAARALDAEVQRRKICVHSRWLRIVAGVQPPRN
jgi:hypothetical protein